MNCSKTLRLTSARSTERKVRGDKERKRGRRGQWEEEEEEGRPGSIRGGNTNLLPLSQEENKPADGRGEGETRESHRALQT